MIRTLLLDLDDTILDNRSGVAAAWDHIAGLLARALDDVPRLRVRAEIGRVTDWFWSDAERHRVGRLDLVAARREILGRVLEALGRPDPALAESAAAAYVRHRESTLALEPGALEALRRLRARVPRLGMVTNGASDAQRAKIERFDLAPFFDHIQVEGEAGVGKPERRAYERALAALGAEPWEALMVGDNFECDVLGALGAGIAAAWIDLHGRGEAPAAAPRAFHIVRSIREVEALLGD